MSLHEQAVGSMPIRSG